MLPRKNSYLYNFIKLFIISAIKVKPQWSFLVGVNVLLLSCGPGGETTNSSPKPEPSPITNGSCTSGPTSVAINYFVENPRTSSGNAALPFTSSLTTAQTSVASISGLVGNCLLQSDRFKIASDSIFPAYVVPIVGNGMYYAPTQPEFRQLNAFYYATAVKNLMTTLSANLTSLGTVNIDTHCNAEDNAYYSPSSRRVCLGYTVVSPTKVVWAADDADVVIHEVGHSVNHTLASTSIMNSSLEAGAIDESLADYWALSILNDGQLSEWFLGAIGASYVRDATQNHLYPNSLVAEIHDDSRILTEVLWDLSAAGNLGKTIVDGLVKRSLQLLPATARFKDFYQAFYDASGPAFLNLTAPERAMIVTKFTNKGLHRVDDATGLRLSTAGGVQQVYVLDDYTYSVQANGNCNGVLDVNETALVLVNLENPNAGRMGSGVANLGAAPAGIQIVSGGAVGDFFRLNANSDFVSSLPVAAYNREEAVFYASFLLKATTAGLKNFSLTFTPMYSDATGVAPLSADVNVNFSLTVGNTASNTNCVNASLWP